MQWIAAHWHIILIGGLVAVQMINKITTRWDELDGPEWKRVLLLYSELASIVVSKGHTGVLGWLKLPGDPFGGRAKAVRPPTAGVTIVLMMVMITAFSCAPTWRQQADQSVRIVHETGKSAWDAARAVLHQRCMEAIGSCESNYDGTCDSYARCLKLRRDLATAMKATQYMIAEANDALIAYDRLQHSGASESDLAAKQAEVKERVNRAKRENMSFLDTLQREGLRR